MQKLTTLLLAFFILVVSCSAKEPVTPDLDISAPPFSSRIQSDYHKPYCLWGEWTFYIDETHTKIDVVPKRYGRFHLNALKFLESYCSDCLQITGLENNGDGTINLTVQIMHPFPGFPEYTGFDVKGIIMFEGSHEFPDNMEKYPLYPQNFRASWRLLGDPELLNADGYSYRWSPWYESGSDMPIFNYWPGKFSNGTPTANVNGYLNFYSNEDRHMFECDATVSRTYHVSLPPGPVVVGYAVEACWEPPLVMPVTNPAEDFPITANQPEAYHFNVVFNDGQPITDPNCCNMSSPWTVHEARWEIDMWYPPSDFTGTYWIGAWTDEFSFSKPGAPGSDNCDGPPNWFCYTGYFGSTPDGTYQWIAVEWHKWHGPGEPAPNPAIDLFEVVVDLD